MTALRLMTDRDDAYWTKRHGLEAERTALTERAIELDTKGRRLTKLERAERNFLWAEVARLGHELESLHFAHFCK